MEILQFIFSSLWIWLGTMFLIGAVFAGIAKVVYAFRERWTDD